MLELLIGIDAARRRTEELLAYDEPARGNMRKSRRDPSQPRMTVSMLMHRLLSGSVQRSRDTSTRCRDSSESPVR